MNNNKIYKSNFSPRENVYIYSQFSLEQILDMMGVKRLLTSTVYRLNVESWCKRKLTLLFSSPKMVSRSPPNATIYLKA